MTPLINFRYAFILLELSRVFYKPAQFVGHGWVLNLVFGSLQANKWLPRYGHFKVSGWMACQVCTQGTFNCPVCTNVSQSAQDTRHGFITTRGWSDDHIIAHELM
jgi:hypothetical protein